MDYFASMPSSNHQLAHSVDSNTKQKKKAVVKNILLSGYLREHEEDLDMQIPHLVSSVLSDYTKQYSTQTIHTVKGSKSNSLHTLNTLINTTDESNIATSFARLPVTSKRLLLNIDKCRLKEMDDIMSQTNDQIVQIQAGTRHTVFLTLSGKVYAFGANDSGQCGLGQQNTNIKVPTLIPFECKIKSIACGALHSLFLDHNGKLLVCGYNFCGQLGIDNKTEAAEGYDYDCDSDSDDFFHSDSESESDSDDDLDDEFFSTSHLCEYTPIYNTYFAALDIKFKQIECGLHHSLCITTTGNVYLFGLNAFGNIGNGDRSEWGKGVNHPYQLKMNKKFITGACGKNCNVLITKNNEIVMFGANRNNEPTIISKQKEFGISDDYFIEKVMCLNYEIIAVIDVFKRITLP